MQFWSPRGGDEARRDPISVKMLKTNGDRIMAQTGEKPGKKLGYILHALLEEALDDPSKNNEAYLKTRVLELNKLPEAELLELSEAGKQKQEEEEKAALKDIDRKHHIGWDIRVAYNGKRPKNSRFYVFCVDNITAWSKYRSAISIYYV